MSEVDPAFLSIPLEALKDAALDAMAAVDGLEYGDIRVHRDRTQTIHVCEHELDSLGDSQIEGFGIRIIVNGSWGVAGTSELTADAVRKGVASAGAMARLLRPMLEERVELAAEPPHRATWAAEVVRNPFAIDPDEKINFMLGVTETALEVGAKFAEFNCAQVQENRFFASTEGSSITQQRIRLDPLLEVGLVDEGGSGQIETMRSSAMPMGTGWEYMEGHGFQDEVGLLVEWLKEKLVAPSVSPGAYDLVIDPTNLWLTIHESVAHATELDRALGYEANFAGTSFATPDKIGRFRYGSPLMNITGDRLEPSGLATVGFDDEGVAAQRWDIVKDGIFVGYQLDRQMAQKFGLARSNGCAFADNWSRVPLQRMPNISLMPNGAHDVSTDDLIGDVDEGIYIVGDKSMSIDQQRYNFQFTGQRFYRIHRGCVAGQLRDVAYQSRTPDFWSRLEGIGGGSSWKLGGSFTCGKGEPGQSAPVSHGCPPGLFRQVNVLNTRREGRV
jgi:TldD protein